MNRKEQIKEAYRNLGKANSVYDRMMTGTGSVRVWERETRTIRRLRMTAMTKEMIQKRKREQCAWRNSTRKEEL